MKKISVLIPCYNEAKAIETVIKAFPVKEITDRGYLLDIIVIDNNSKDATATLAAQAGARVIHEKKQGKGHAIRAGLYAIADDTDYVVMLDGDDTYAPKEMLRLVEPLESGFADAIVGSRMAGKIREHSMSASHHLANWGFSFLVRIVYKLNVTDVLTGYFAWTRDAAIKLRPHVKSAGFALEMEMITKMARLDLDVYSVPITYQPRLGGSSLKPIRDGLKVLGAFFRQLRWKPRAERLVFVTDAIYPYNKGGKERRLHEIVKRLKSEDRQIHIYTMKWWDGDQDIVVDGVYLHGICKYHSLYAGDKRSIREALMFSLACFKLVTKPFDSIDVDQIPFIPLFTMRLVCWLRGKTMYSTWYEVWGKDYWLDYMGILGYLGWIYEYISLRIPNVIISISQHTTDNLASLGISKKVRTIPLGVDVTTIFDAPVGSFESDLIYVGRLLGNKNVAMLVHSIAELKTIKPDISCVIVGEGPEKASLQKLSASLGLESNITFLSFIEDNAELYGLMKASKVFVLPSNREGFGLVALEANACGLPVLTLDHPKNAATKLIHEGENGFLFKDEATLVRLLKRYFSDDGDKPEFSAHVEDYDWSVTADMIQKEYTL